MVRVAKLLASFWVLVSVRVAGLAVQDNYAMPPDLLHSGLCTEQTAGKPCALPINADMSFSDLGAGTMTSVNVSVDVYPGPTCWEAQLPESIFTVWSCSENPEDKVEPAIVHSLEYKTVIRIIFPRGYNTSAARLAGEDSNGVISVRVVGKNFSNTTLTSIRFKRVKSPLALKEGVPVDPPPYFLPTIRYDSVGDTLVPVANITYRTGTLYGLRDPDVNFDASRVVDLETFEEASTESEDRRRVLANSTQRLLFGIDRVVHRRALGSLGSAIVEGERLFAVQIYKVAVIPTTSYEREGYLMRFYNQRLFDPCLFGNAHSGPTSLLVCPTAWREDPNLPQAYVGVPWFATTNTQELFLICPAGTFFVPDTDGKQCVPCPSGEVSNRTMSPGCTKCPAGTFADLRTAFYPGGGASACPLCLPGTVSSEAQALCTPCPLGYFAGSSGGLQCSTCPKGTFSNRTGSSVCTSCPVGTTTPSSGSTSPDACQGACFPGAFSATGTTPCAPCARGTFAARRGTLVCEPCAAGYAAPQEGQSVCEPCAPGTYAQGTGSEACLPCPRGSYTETYATQSCVRCGDDERAQAYMTTNNLGPTALSQTYIDDVTALGRTLSEPVIRRTAVAGANSPELCWLNCLPGTHSFAGGLDGNTTSTRCVSCDGGSSSALIGTHTCPYCSPGFYSPDKGALKCLQCEPGTFAGREGATRCVVCPPGQTSGTLGESSSSSASSSQAYSCVPCGNGTASPSAGSPKCVPCPEGSYAVEGSLVCQECPSGTSTFRGDPSSVGDCVSMASQGVVGHWDVWEADLDSTYSRPRRNDSDCVEIHDLEVSPSTVLDRSGVLGNAVMRGPACTSSTSWDAADRDALGVHSLVVNDGRVSALDFDGRLNTGFLVGGDAGVEGLLQTKPAAVPVAAMSIETWIALDGEATTLSGLAGAYQEGPRYGRGWALSHVYDSNRKDSWFISLVMATNQSVLLSGGAQSASGGVADAGLGLRRALAKITPPPAVGTWFHLAVTYDGSLVRFYINGDLISSASPCSNRPVCGNIVYPSAADKVPNRTPLTIGATLNGYAIGAAASPHRGMMKSMRISSRALLPAEVMSRALIGAARVQGSVRMYKPWYWAGVSSQNASSPDVTEVSVDINTLGPVIVREGQLASIKILGRFGVGEKYTCSWVFGGAEQASDVCAVTDVLGQPVSADKAHYGEMLVCPYPLWRYGVTNDAVLRVNMKGAGVVWQGVCLTSRCGYADGLRTSNDGPWWQAAGVHALNGSKVHFSYLGTQCSPGTFAPEGGVAPYCRACNPGLYSDEPGSVACTACPKGTYVGAALRATFCIDCAPGKFTADEASLDASACVPTCQAGSASPTRLEPCEICSKGFYAPVDGSLECAQCPPGTSTKGVGASECTALCAPGQFEPEWGLAPCQTCPAGKKAALLGSKSCQPCIFGEYSPAGSAECFPCPTFCEIAKNSFGVSGVVNDQCCIAGF